MQAAFALSIIIFKKCKVDLCLLSLDQLVLFYTFKPHLLLQNFLSILLPTKLNQMLSDAARSLLIIICLTLFTGCINLKNVRDYTKSSITTIGKFEELHYSFYQHCTDRCLFNAVQQSRIGRENECDCSTYIKADSVTFVLYNAINAYFGALGNLAADDLTNYTLTPVQKALTEQFIPVSGKMIEITGDQVSSYGKIASILLRASTNGYRKKKIKQFIDEGNAPIKILIDAFQNILSQNLSGVMNFKKERLYAFYNEIVLDSTSSIYERRKATLEFYEEIDKVNSKQKQVEALSRSLKKVAQGHEQLSKSNMSAKELQEMLTPISSDIKALISEFNKFKNS